MNPDFIRGQQLLALQRHADAADCFRACIAQEPQSAPAHALLSLCLSSMNKPAEALAAAEQAIALAPDADLAHYARAVAFAADHRYREAEDAIAEAIRLDPEDADHYGLLAAVRNNRAEHAGALDAADRGLAVDPEHRGCVDARAHALTRLGRAAEAANTIAGALERDPEDAATHANQGWALLHRNQPKQAMVHFEEALRLDPGYDFARAGLVEAMKARNPLYRLMLAFLLWMSRLPEGARWAIVLGGMFGHRVVGNLSEQHPDLAWLLDPLWWAYLAFAILTWVSDPLFNLLLWLHPRGRYALAPRQRQGAVVMAAALAIGAAGLLWTLAQDNPLGILTSLLALMLGCHANSALQAWNPRHRRILLATVGALALTGSSGLLLVLQEDERGLALWRVTFYGWIGYMFLHGWLIRRGH